MGLRGVRPPNVRGSHDPLLPRRGGLHPTCQQAARVHTPASKINIPPSSLYYVGDARPISTREQIQAALREYGYLGRRQPPAQKLFQEIRTTARQRNIPLHMEINDLFEIMGVIFLKSRDRTI